jgi:hypothetical protein
VLALTWSGGTDGPSEVTFELTPKADKVLMVLTHRKLADRRTMVGVGAGWHTHVGILSDRLEGHEPQAFWSTFTRLEREYEERLIRE